MKQLRTQFECVLSDIFVCVNNQMVKFCVICISRQQLARQPRVPRSTRISLQLLQLVSCQSNVSLMEQLSDHCKKT